MSDPSPVMIGVTPGPEQFPGVTRVFREAQGLGVCKHVYVDDLPAAAREHPDAMVMFGAVHEAYGVHARRVKNRKGILWTSPLLQSDLSGEHGALMLMASLRGQGIVQDLWPMDRGLFELLYASDQEHTFWFSPPVASLPKAPEGVQRDYKAAALFGPFHPRKNVLAQVLAARAAGYEVHANGLGEYAQVFQAFGVEVKDHGWMPREQYFATLAGMGVSLCAYLSESFCYAALDAAALGVPFLASPAIRWAPQEFTAISEDRAFADPGDVRAIAAVLGPWLKESTNKRMGRIARHRAEKVMEQSNQLLLEELTRAGLTGKPAPAAAPTQPVEGKP